MLARADAPRGPRWLKARSSVTAPWPVDPQSCSGPVVLIAAGAGGLGVADADDHVIAVGEAGHAAQGALAARRVVPQPALLCRLAGHPDGELMTDADRLVAAGLPGGVGHDGVHPGRDAPVRLTPGRQERVGKARPVE